MQIIIKFNTPREKFNFCCALKKHQWPINSTMKDICYFAEYPTRWVTSKTEGIGELLQYYRMLELEDRYAETEKPKED